MVTLQNMVQNETKKRRTSIVLRTLLMLTLLPLLLMGGAIVALYIPQIQNYAVEKVCESVKISSGYDIKMRSFHLSFPLKATIKDFEVAKNDTTIAKGEQIETSIRILPLIKGRIEVDYLSVDQTTADTYNIIDGVSINGNIGHLRVTSRSINPSGEKAKINHLHIADSNVDILLKEKEKEDSTSTPFNWLFTLRKGNISNVKVSLNMPADTTTFNVKIDALKINNANIKPGEGSYSADDIIIENSNVAYDIGTLPDSIAPLNHIVLNGIDLSANDIIFETPVICADINNLSFTQPNGVKIVQATTKFAADSNKLDIEKLQLRTANNSRIKLDAAISTGFLYKDKESEIKTDASLLINKKDLRRLLPDTQYKRLQFLPDSLLQAYTRLSGTSANLHIDTLTAEIPGLIHIETSGTLHNINNSKLMRGNATLNGYITDIHRIIEQRIIPDSIEKQTLRIAGSTTIENQQYSAMMRLRTNNGRAIIGGSYNTNTQEYTARARARNINIADILSDVPLHKVTMSLEATGKGFDLFADSTQYNCNLNIDTIFIDSTRLTNIHFTARQKEKDSHIEATSTDSALQMRIKMQSRFDRQEIINHTLLTLQSANLELLQLTQAPLTATMEIDIQAYSNMLDCHSAKVTGNNIRLITSDKTYTPAELQFTGYTSPDTSYTHLHTGDLSVNGTLGCGYSRLLESFEQIKSMYEQGRVSEKTLYYIQDFQRKLPSMTLNINCGRGNIFSNFMRFNRTDFNSFDLTLSIDSINGINGSAGLYQLKREDIQLDTIHFSLRQDDNRLRYFAGIRTRSLNPEQPKLKFYSALYGALQDDSISTNFIFRDNNDNVSARIGINTLLLPEGLDIRFKPKATLFNKPFVFNTDNYLLLRKNMEIRTNIELTDSNESGMRLFSSKDSTVLRDISLELFNVDLQAATRIIPYAPDIAGILNMDLHYKDDDKGISISSDISGTDIVYDGTPIGDETIELTYLPKRNDTHYIHTALLHNEREVLNISGDYNSNNQRQPINGKARLTHFPLSLSSAILKETGIKLDGYIDSELSIKGRLDAAEADGYVNFDSVYADAPTFGTRLHLNDGRVEIKENKLLFDNFDIYAHSSTPFQVKGTIDLKNLTNPQFNLRAHATNYELINAKRTKGAMLYGRMFINLNSSVNGTLNALKLNGSATLLGKSDITYILPETPLAAENELDGLVTFVNFADTTQVDKAEEQELDFGNLQMNITLDIEEGARINADFDENRNSYIELQGGGKLHLTYSNEANINLTGRYTLSNGQLKYTLPIIPLKTFSISDGSYINWTGDIANPTLNITALERITSSVTMDDGNTQAVAFDVGVELSNTLENMGLSFTLSAPENAAVQNQLNTLDKETLNKYAVTMLITGAYIGSEGGLSVSNAISSFLDARINDIAGNAMSSVNISVGITDVENAETGNTYKNYSFSFAKRFWNDRLTIVIGGEVNSGDTHNRNESFINNVSLEWKVSDNSNRYIRLFYDKNYESILEGEIIETGIGYVYKRKLDSLKELFLFRRKDKREELLIRQLNNSTKEPRKKK